MSDTWELISERPGGTVSNLLAGDAGVLALTTAAVHRSVDRGATWSTVTAVRLGPPLNAVAQSGASVFVGAQGGLHRSRDLGRSWSTVLSGGCVVCLGIIPGAERRTLLAGTQSDGLLRSEDDGNSWASANPGLFDLTVLCLATTSSGVSFAGTPTGMYRSANAGRSWRELALPCGAVGVECLAASDEIVLAGTDSAGTFVSVDRGRTWSLLSGLEESAATAAMIGPDGALLAVGSPNGVYISRDRGQTWSFRAVGCVLSLAYVAGRLLAGLAIAGIVRLELASGEWQVSSTGLNGRLIVDFGHSSHAHALLTADLEDGIQRSTDVGRTWHTAGEAPVAASRLVFAGGVAFAATTTGLYASHDDGMTWTALHQGAGACAVAAAPNGAVLAAFDESQLVLLDDGQRTCMDWDTSRGRIVAVAVYDAQNLFVGTLGERTTLWRSTDGGHSWTAWFRTDRAESMCMAVSPEFSVDDQVLVAVGTRVFRPVRHTRERRGSEVHPIWHATLVPDPITNIVFGATPGTIYAATSHGVQRSVDGAEHLSAWSDGLPRDIPVLAIQPMADAVYALGFGGTLWRRRASSARNSASAPWFRSRRLAVG